MDELEIYRAMQRISRAVQAIRADVNRIADFVIRDLQLDASEKDKADLIHLMRKEEFQKELLTNWETIFYRHSSPGSMFVLITAALPDSAKDAKMLTQRRLVNTKEACSFCGLIEQNAPVELIEAKTPTGAPIQSEYVHKRCALFWQRLKLIAARDE